FFEAFVTADEVDGECAVDRVLRIVGDISAAGVFPEALAARPGALGLGLVEIPGDLPVPWIAVEGEFEIAPPHLLADIIAYAPRRHVLVEADARVVIALGAHQQLAPERALRLQSVLDAIVLGGQALAVLLALLAIGRDHVR